ncbi:MAG: DUF58 domain-containing protein [Armatimonadota bacterium]|nr:DUF58 domain-containing protein [Armatimonadota bacterium]
MILTGAAIIILAIGVLPLALSTIDSAFLFIAAVYNAAVVLAVITDYRRAPDASKLFVERECEEELSMGEPNQILLRVRNLGDIPATIDVRDETPVDFNCSENTARVSVPAHAELEHIYLMEPYARGDFQFGDIYIRSYGKLGLAARQFKIPSARHIRVYPDILQAKKYDLARRRGRLMEIGSHRTKFLGIGTEFESLRDYQPDDEYRRIDWKASARRARLTSRQYQLDRTQNILLVLDAGRTMCVSLDGMTKLDYAINAALMLAYVASSGDDKVGMLVFSDEINSYLPPRRGRGHFLNMLQALYNAPFTTRESDYGFAFRFISSRWRKRSLLVVFSDLIDKQSSSEIIANLAAVSRKHLCLCVAIGDPQTNAAAVKDPAKVDEVYEQAVAIQTLQARKQAIAALAGAGVMVIDAEPSGLASAIVGKYSEIKSRLLL